MLMIGCTKEYSPEVSNDIKVSISAIKYTTTVNGSTGDYWKVTVGISKPIDKGIHIVYSFDDERIKEMSISHWLDKESTSNIFFTQYSAKGNVSNVRLIRVIGADNYKFILQN